MPCLLGMKIIMITRKTDVNAIICPLEEDGRAENLFLHLGGVGWGGGGKKMIKYQVIVKGILDEFHLTIHNNIL